MKKIPLAILLIFLLSFSTFAGIVYDDDLPDMRATREDVVKFDKWFNETCDKFERDVRHMTEEKFSRAIASMSNARYTA